MSALKFKLVKEEFFFKALFKVLIPLDILLPCKFKLVKEVLTCKKSDIKLIPFLLILLYSKFKTFKVLLNFKEFVSNSIISSFYSIKP